MSKLILYITITLSLSGLLFAQKGTAGPGYYPNGYGGDTWTGNVTEINEQTREVTLTYQPKKKPAKTFVAILPEGYKAKVAGGEEQVVQMKNLVGYKVMVYYTTKTKKEPDGSKTSVSYIFKLAFLGKAD